jgi:hypothetical protein
MDFEWFNDIDRVVWHLEEVMESAAKKAGLMGAAPSACDEARARLRRNSSGKRPLDLINEVEGFKESDCKAASETLAAEAVDRAYARSSQHVTREDVAGAVGGAPYPYSGSR